MSEQPKGKVIIVVAPSGSGKTTIARMLLEEMDKVRFSVSATTRPARPGEKHGVDYFFLSEEEFDRKINDGGFLEWEYYNGKRYGTLRSEVDKLMEMGYFPLLDIEVKGALNVKRMYGSQSLAVFIQPPSLEELERRLAGRGTEDEQTLASRLKLARKEMQYADRFDHTVVNDELEEAFQQVKQIVELFIADKP
ncbi:MAG: guanylate kinase [Balneolaceae bacterium]|nr:guanylate kinase [Balneolaceae bacterium]